MLGCLPAIAQSLPSRTQRGISLALVDEKSCLVNQRGCDGAVMRKNFGRRLNQFGASFRERWRRMKVIHAAFEQSADGALSRGRSEERFRDEEAGSRMNDDCPPPQQPYPQQDIIREDGGTGSACPPPAFESPTQNVTVRIVRGIIDSGDATRVRTKSSRG